MWMVPSIVHPSLIMQNNSIQNESTKFTLLTCVLRQLTALLGTTLTFFPFRNVCLSIQSAFNM